MQDNPWDNHVFDSLQLNDLPAPFDQDGIYPNNRNFHTPYDTKTSLLCVQEEVQQWAEENFSSQPASSPAALDSDEENICYGLV